ncbi:hypothetical protein, conserved [Trypanosoma brucei brucei TREU927]|uniref:Uncharacterized protein n=1 Tax=Trypanosoma brucei brucei (strain 927/4 GUTat10.1) TaxID=185431 RepID=Q57XH0_TRYB2|nr:hypothetical protein, conserved [Trypanosoma brucei brucei TREU927]AAX69699.1 hypothetical protein, conserved [Trypanosoma brucei]AAZ11141.1 hypothetical protein, conserved [Trypanosoma brucei brucei TREU927]
MPIMCHRNPFHSNTITGYTSGFLSSPPRECHQALKSGISLKKYPIQNVSFIVSIISRIRFCSETCLWINFPEASRCCCCCFRSAVEQCKVVRWHLQKRSVIRVRWFVDVWVATATLQFHNISLYPGFYKPLSSNCHSDKLGAAYHFFFVYEIALQPHFSLPYALRGHRVFESLHCSHLQSREWSSGISSTVPYNFPFHTVSRCWKFPVTFTKTSSQLPTNNV